MPAGSASGITNLLNLNATATGTVGVSGGTGTTTQGLSAKPGQYNENQSAGFQVTGSTTNPNYGFIRFPLTAATNLNGKIVCLGFQFNAAVDKTRLTSKANGGQSIVFYSNAGFTESAEFYLAGTDADLIDPSYKGWANILIRPDNTAAAFGVTAGYSPSTITAVEFRVRKFSTAAVASFYHRLQTSDAFVLTLGEAANPATLDNILTHAAANFTYAFRRPAIGQYNSLFPIQLGDGTTVGLFEQSDVSLTFVGAQDSSADPQYLIFQANSLGLRIKANETANPTRFSISSRSKWFLHIEAGAIVNWRGGTFSRLGANSIATGALSGITFSECSRVDGGSGTFSNCLFSGTDDSSGAFHLKTTTTLGSANRFEGNTVGPAIYINQAGTFNLAAQTFSGNTQNVRVDGVAATLQLSAAQFSTYTANAANFPITTINGGSVTVAGPVSQIVLSNIPLVTGALVGVINLTTMAQTFPTITGGVANIPTDPGTNYLIAVDAPGWVRQQVILSGATPAFTLDWTNRDFRDLYDQGDPLYEGIDLDYSTFAVTVDQSTLQIDPATAFRRIEDLLATPQAIFFPNPPSPLVVELSELVAEYYLVFPYDQENDEVNPVVIRPHPSNTVDVTLVGFSILLKGAADPFYDIFDFTQQPNGRIIRINTKSTFVQNVVSGGLSTADRAVIDAIALRTVDLPELIEDSGGKRFKAKALETAPASPGLSDEDREAIYAIALHTVDLPALIEDSGGKRFKAKALEAAPAPSGGGLGPEDIERLERIEQQLIADIVKGATRYKRLLPGTSTVILDKDVIYDPATGFTLTEHEEPTP